MKITFTLEQLSKAFGQYASPENIQAAMTILKAVDTANFDDWLEVIKPYHGWQKNIAGEEYFCKVIPEPFVPSQPIEDNQDNRADIAFFVSNYLLSLHGEESVGRSDILSSYTAIDATFGQSLGTVAYRYLNSGDCYNTTLIHDLISDRLFISTVGDTEEHFDKVARLIEQLKQANNEPDDIGYKVILIQKPETSIYSLVVGENVSPDYEGLAVYRWADDEAYQDLAIELLTETFGDRIVGNHLALIA